MTPCFVCGKPSRKGYHKKCLDRSVARSKTMNKERPVTEENSIQCKHCPFRRGSQWMDKGRKLLNVMRVQSNVVQECHRREGSLYCMGNIICLEGGDCDIYSPTELAGLPTADTKEMYRLYLKRGPV